MSPTFLSAEAIKIGFSLPMKQGCWPHKDWQKERSQEFHIVDWQLSSDAACVACTETKSPWLRTVSLHRAVIFNYLSLFN